MLTDTRLDELLDSLEPDTPPSMRRNQLRENRRVLELRDPNDGSNARYQYARSAGQLWARRLPAEALGDVWEGESEPPRWEITQLHRAQDTLRKAFRALPDLLSVVLRRQELRRGDERLFIVRGAEVKMTHASDCAAIFGPLIGEWWSVPLPVCPDCSEPRLVWHEAACVPGTRLCSSCGSLFSVSTVRVPQYKGYLPEG